MGQHMVQPYSKGTYNPTSLSGAQRKRKLSSLPQSGSWVALLLICLNICMLLDVSEAD